MARAVNEVINDGADFALAHSPLLVRFVEKRLLTDHAEQVAGNYSQFQNYTGEHKDFPIFLVPFSVLRFIMQVQR